MKIDAELMSLIDAETTQSIQDIIAQLQDVRAKLVHDADELDARLRAKRASIVRIDRIIRVAEPPEKQEKKTPLRNKKRKTNVSRAKINHVYSVLAKHRDGLTTQQLAQLSGINENSVRYAITTLREQERVRKAGKVARTPGRGLPPTLWKVMP